MRSAPNDLDIQIHMETHQLTIRQFKFTLALELSIERDNDVFCPLIDEHGMPTQILIT